MPKGARCGILLIGVELLRKGQNYRAIELLPNESVSCQQMYGILTKRGGNQPRKNKEKGKSSNGRSCPCNELKFRLILTLQRYQTKILLKIGSSLSTISTS